MFEAKLANWPTIGESGMGLRLILGFDHGSVAVSSLTCSFVRVDDSVVTFLSKVVCFGTTPEFRRVYAIYSCRSLSCVFAGKLLEADLKVTLFASFLAAV